MRAVRFLVCAVLPVLALAGCQAADRPVPVNPTGAMKGYELYSWQ